MIIFGWSAKTVIQAVINYFCLGCGTMSEHAVTQRRRWFTLFFIPVIPFHQQRQQVCYDCGTRAPYTGPVPVS